MVVFVDGCGCWLLVWVFSGLGFGLIVFRVFLFAFDLGLQWAFWCGVWC